MRCEIIWHALQCKRINLLRASQWKKIRKKKKLRVCGKALQSNGDESDSELGMNICQVNVQSSHTTIGTTTLQQLEHIEN